MGGRTHGGRDQSWEQERRRQHVWIHVASHLSSAVYGVTAKDERKEGRKEGKEGNVKLFCKVVGRQDGFVCG